MNWDIVLLENSSISCNTKEIFLKKCSVTVYCFESMLPLTRTYLNISLEQNAPHVISVF